MAPGDCWGGVQGGLSQGGEDSLRGGRHGREEVGRKQATEAKGFQCPAVARVFQTHSGKTHPRAVFSLSAKVPERTSLIDTL